MLGRNFCPYCHDSSHIYVSRVKTFLDRAAIFLLLRPVRCHCCLGRFYRPVFVKVLPRPTVRRKAQEFQRDICDSGSSTWHLWARYTSATLGPVWDLRPFTNRTDASGIMGISAVLSIWFFALAIDPALHPALGCNICVPNADSAYRVNLLSFSKETGDTEHRDHGGSRGGCSCHLEYKLARDAWRQRSVRGVQVPCDDAVPYPGRWRVATPNKDFDEYLGPDMVQLFPGDFYRWECQQ